MEDTQRDGCYLEGCNYDGMSETLATSMIDACVWKQWLLTCVEVKEGYQSPVGSDH